MADAPPARDVNTIAEVFMDTNGDLAQLSFALINLQSAFTTEARKFRTPQEYVLAVGRAFRVREVPRNMFAVLRPLRQPYWGALSPAGYGDTAQDWADPDALVKRTELARQIAKTAKRGRMDAAELAPQLIEAHDPNVLHLALTSQKTSSDALALLLASPDFQWR